MFLICIVRFRVFVFLRFRMQVGRVDDRTQDSVNTFVSSGAAVRYVMSPVQYYTSISSCYRPQVSLTGLVLRVGRSVRYTWYTNAVLHEL